MSEAALVNELRVIAEAAGAMLAVIGQRKARGSGTTTGMPDLVLIDHGQIRLIECKRPATAEHPRGDVSVGQQAFIDRALDHGVHVYVVDSVEAFMGVLSSCRRAQGVVRRAVG